MKNFYLFLEKQIIKPIFREFISRRPNVVEDNVWIGDKSTVLAGVTIGENSMIVAHAVITRNVLSNSVVVGIPSRVIKITHY